MAEQYDVFGCLPLWLWVVIIVMCLVGFGIQNAIKQSQGSSGTKQPGEQEGTRRVKCPYCAEMIMPDAKVCRFCGRDLTDSN